MSFLTSSGVFSKKDKKSFVRYSAPEKYCEYGVYQVGLCLSHSPRGGGGEGWAASQSKVESCTTFRTTQEKGKNFPALAQYTSGLGFKFETQNNNLK